MYGSIAVGEDASGGMGNNGGDRGWDVLDDGCMSVLVIIERRMICVFELRRLRKTCQKRKAMHASRAPRHENQRRKEIGLEVN